MSKPKKHAPPEFWIELRDERDLLLQKVAKLEAELKAQSDKWRKISEIVKGKS